MRIELRVRTLWPWLIALLVALAAAPAPAQQDDRVRVLAAVDSLVEAALASGPIAGASVAVVRGSEVVLARGYGYADLENRVPARVETVYRVGSITKQFTAAAILRLAEEGKLRLEDDVTRYLPDYPTRGRRITLHHLLTHTSGIRSYTSLGEAWREKQRLDLSPEELIALFRNEPLDFSPGAEYRYNNSGYFLLGEIIARVSGLSYANFLSRHFFRPLGLDRTHYCDERALIPDRARGYDMVEGRLANAAMISMNTPGAAGALCSTVLDLIRWTDALHSGRVLSAESFRQMTTPARLADGSRVEYGYGLRLTAPEGRRKVYHTGSINGFQGILARYPEHDLTVVVLTNTLAGGPRLDEPIEQDIARTILKGFPSR